MSEVGAVSCCNLQNQDLFAQIRSRVLRNSPSFNGRAKSRS